MNREEPTLAELRNLLDRARVVIYPKPEPGTWLPYGPMLVELCDAVAVIVAWRTWPEPVPDVPKRRGLRAWLTDLIGRATAQGPW